MNFNFYVNLISVHTFLKTTIKDMSSQEFLSNSFMTDFVSLRIFLNLKNVYIVTTSQLSENFKFHEVPYFDLSHLLPPPRPHKKSQLVKFIKFFICFKFIKLF